MKRLALLVAAPRSLAGCGEAKDEGISGGGKVIGRTVTVYSLTTDPGGAGRDFVDGEKLALSDAGGRAGDLAVNFTSLDLGADERRAGRGAPGARSTTRRSSPRSSTRRSVTVPLFNAAGILQVAPGGDAAWRRDPNMLPSGKPTVEALDGRASRPTSPRASRRRSAARRATARRTATARWRR